MRRNVFATILLVACILVISCNTNKLNKYDCKFIGTIEQLGDSTYLSEEIGQIVKSKKSIIMSDALNARCIVFDTTFKFQKSLGGQGSGPGEFLGTSKIFTYRDTIYVYDFRKNIISAMSDEGKIFREFAMPVRLDSKPVMDMDGNIYVSTPFQKETITVYDLSGNKKRAFGKLNTKWSEEKAQQYNRKNLELISDSVIIAVYESIPLIQMYNTQGSLLAEKDISDIREVSNIFDEDCKYPMLLNKQTAHHEKSIYVLMYQKYENTSWANIIIEYFINDKKITGKNVYKLEKKKGVPSNYHAFVVANNRIMLFNTNDKTLDIYQFTESK